MTQQQMRAIWELRAAGEPVETRRPPVAYVCPDCGTAWIPATLYEKSPQDMQSAISGLGKDSEYRRCLSCGGAHA